MNIGRAIRFARAARGISQQELATRVSISASYLSLVESSKKDPSIAMIRSIARGLRISEDVLILTAVDYASIRAADVETLAALSEQLLVAAVRQGTVISSKRKVNR
jgi:transcriptional regulator with XRE-family HTH domain